MIEEGYDILLTRMTLLEVVSSEISHKILPGLYISIPAFLLDLREDQFVSKDCS